ncbi:50S ribosomal protein L13 [Jiulongibacter sediminis]|uniref:Large ribosomal subunit protein uL13 n=1 Tax=Jiulongibacter sediminis TaxID=1605367 RepID=A0A0P7BUZ5_9BACT|nr:50S ribosomal protein L13 [Jiulongibacter sediminis]KPM48518.1 50S ribosomal protein L13 [Jiulongibacter sediminis]TBX25057.1 50S ribosomal protein L13 [Jiulongibacter sediminis]
MDTLSYKTISANKQTVNKEWVVVDAKDQIVGRLSSKIASILRGKHKTNFTPNVDCGDNVIVINAEKVRFTGKKMNDKQYVRHTGHPGGQRFATPRELMEKDGRRVVEYAVKGMLPKTRLGRQQFTNLYVYEGAEHPHEAQSPKSIEI